MQNDDERGGELRQFFPSSYSVLFPVLHPFHPFSSFLSSFLSFHPFISFLFIPSFLCSLQFSRVKEENYVSVMSWEREPTSEKRKDKLSSSLSLDFWYIERMKGEREEEERKRKRTKLKGGKNKLREIEQKVVTLFSCCKKILPLVPLLLFLSCFIGKEK